MTDRPHYDGLVELLARHGKHALAEALARMLVNAGAISQWDSATIERVLQPTEAMLKESGVPWIGTADDPSALRYWIKVADDLGWEHDDIPTEDEEEIGSWVEQIQEREGDYMMAVEALAEEALAWRRAGRPTA